MAYDKIGFVNDSPPYMNDANMNHMDDGIAAAHNSTGTTAQRPDLTGKPASNLGYFDTTLGQMIYWNGTEWVDAMGNATDTVYITEV